ncbi:Hypothetical predicted protein [Podarcis lilfordi]|uniref:Uncharacterized protein n=1 Tax=Podarcis lilfordi TaxID=74358 RepID=A0AA35P8B8_9SAUR|nr:Hypothetical predicted protein [Podarcis lilfordi]
MQGPERMKQSLKALKQEQTKPKSECLHNSHCRDCHSYEEISRARRKSACLHSPAESNQCDVVGMGTQVALRSKSLSLLGLVIGSNGVSSHCSVPASANLAV